MDFPRNRPWGQDSGESMYPEVFPGETRGRVRWWDREGKSNMEPNPRVILAHFQRAKDTKHLQRLPVAWGTFWDKVTKETPVLARELVCREGGMKATGM